MSGCANRGLRWGFITPLFIVLAHATAPWVSAKGPLAEQASQILQASGVKGGVVVHVGCGDGKLTAALRGSSAYLVHGLDADAVNVAVARDYIRSLGLYGHVSVDIFDTRHLPYVDNLVNLLVVEERGSLSEEELLRVVAPLGVVYEKVGENWTQTAKPWPSELDQWTHFLHDADNNAVANDTRVGPPRHMQWVAKPLYGRSHEVDTSLSAMVSGQGRLFYIYDEGLIGITDERLSANWSLIARDAFNGVVLWKRPLPEWGWREWCRSAIEGKDWTTLRGLRGRPPAAVARRLVTQGDKLYTTVGYVAPLSILDAATGEILATCEGTDGTDEILYRDGVVIACVRDLISGEAKRRRGEMAPDTIVALNAETGEFLWRAAFERIVPMTLAIRDGRILFCTGKELVCLDLSSSAENWRSPTELKGTLVAVEDVVLVRSGDQFEAYSMDDGHELWKKERAGSQGTARMDLMVVNGLLWHGAPTAGLINDPATYWDQPFDKPRSPQTGMRMVGIDPRTGEERRSIEIDNLLTPGHHFRCYRSKSTERFIILPKRAAEFIDLRGDEHARNDWVRGSCKYGIMPCNGLLYSPPNPCFCSQAANLRGFNALASAQSASQSDPPSAVERLERGPAYGKCGNAPASSNQVNEWPTFRHDTHRSGSTPADVQPDLAQRWQTHIGGRLTQPIVANGVLYVSEIDAHTVHALNASTGETLWRHTAGGRIDSPPTFHDGMLLFGSADGRVTCLRASDGELAWRFLAAPNDLRVSAFGQLESAWPAHGSVLVMNGLAYTSAGRSSYLDGGIYVYALNPRIGTVIHETRIDGPHPDLSEDIGKPFSTEGTFSDVLVTDGTYLYMQQIMLDGQLNQLQPQELTNMGDKKFGRHVFSTAGFLNDDWWNRTFWMHSERYPGFYIAQQAPKTGQLIVFDDENTYGVKCYTKRNVHSPMFFPETTGYLLVADDNDNEPMLAGEPGAADPIRWLPHQHDRDILQLDYRAVDMDKGVGFTRARAPKWAEWLPTRVRGMVLTGNTLFVAGPPDVLDSTDPLAAFEGRKGASLRAVSAANGETLAEYEFESPPVFDGLIAANERLYLALRNGTVVCMEAKGETAAHDKGNLE